MRLAKFIHAEMEAILVEWDAFATGLSHGAVQMTSLTLRDRDHAQQILKAIALDVATAQTPTLTLSASGRNSSGLRPIKFRFY